MSWNQGSKSGCKTLNDLCWPSDSPMETLSLSFKNKVYAQLYLVTHRQIYVRMYIRTDTHNTQHNILIYTLVHSLLVHTSSSSFTLHLPPSRRDWSSCSLPSAAATSRSLSSEALAAACACDDRSGTHSRRDNGNYTHYNYSTKYIKLLVESWVHIHAKLRWGWGQVHMHTVILFWCISNLQSITGISVL